MIDLFNLLRGEQDGKVIQKGGLGNEHYYYYYLRFLGYVES